MAEGPHVKLHLLEREESGRLGGHVCIHSLLSPGHTLSPASLACWSHVLKGLGLSSWFSDELGKPFFRAKLHLFPDLTSSQGLISSSQTPAILLEEGCRPLGTVCPAWEA